MSQPLWKMIGLQHTQIQKQSQEQEFIDMSNCSISRIPQDYAQGVSDNNARELKLFASEPLNGSSFGHLRKKSHVGSRRSQLDIESCESNDECQDGQFSPSPKFMSVVDVSRNEVIQKVRSIMAFVQDLKVSKNSVKKELDNQNREIYYLLKSQGQQLKQIIESYQKRSVVCFKCQNNKKLIEVLTKQCWELEKQMEKKSQECLKIKSQYQMSQIVNESPLKEVERGLLEQRGENIKKLRLQLQGVECENINLKESIVVLEAQLGQFQSQYKSNLFDLKNQIQEIERDSILKIQMLIEEKKALQQEIAFLNDHCSSLIETKTRRDEEKISVGMAHSIKIQQIDRHKKSYQIMGNSLKNLKVEQKKCDTTPRDIIKFKTQMFNNPSHDSLPSRSRERYQSLVFGADEIIQPEKNFNRVINKYKVKHSSFKLKPTEHQTRLTYGGALNNLDVLKREVRRQIKRSKFIMTE